MLRFVRRVSRLTGLAVVAVGLACASHTQAAPDVKTVPPDVKAYRDISYVDGSTDPNQTLDLYVPDNPSKPLPVIAYIHGGGWNGADKSSCPPLYFIHDGYAAVSIEYRFSSKAKFPAQIQDCQAAIRWLRANAAKYHLDPDHIGVWGESAGGHLCALLGTAGGSGAFPVIGGNADQSDRVQAVCDLFGPADFVTVLQQRESNKGIPKWDEFGTGQSYSSLIGAPVGVDDAANRAVSPVTYVSKSSPPFLIYHGTYDQLVPMEQSQELFMRLNNIGDQVLFQPFVHNEHSGAIYWTEPALKLVKAFFDKNLQGADVKLEPLQIEDSTYNAPAN